MKGNARHQPPPAHATSTNSAPLSPTAKGTAKYTNKDGSKFITVPKSSTPVDSSQPSPTTAQASGTKGGPQTAEATGSEAAPQNVNRKKQKRRAKAAAKAAAEQGSTFEQSNGAPSPPAPPEEHVDEAEPDYSDDEDDHYAEADHRSPHPTSNGYLAGTSKSKKSKKKKKKNNAGSHTDEHLHSNHVHHGDHEHHHHHHHTHPLAPRQPSSPSRHHSDHRHGSGISREKIWNTSSQEERERIKEFWLGLSESERKSLVKVEKDAVLRKMKEQQKHTCSCTVCGRKRTAIEEELEGLYDAYYEELEQYANLPGQGDGPPLLPLRRSFGSMGAMRPRSLPSSYTNHQPSHGRIIEHVGDDEDDDEGDEDYSEGDLEEDEYSDEDPSEDLQRPDYAADFFNFGNSLTVQGRDILPTLPAFLQSFLGAGTNANGSPSLGGILTVADDLLKNDGKKFIEMMEQLAERRMQREEDARELYDPGYGPSTNGDRRTEHHRLYPVPVPPEQDYVDEEDDEEYDEEEDEEYDSQEEEDNMTEEQRMEEGRRMFQIFAARMFEQRVLQAYRESVAKQRQAKLLEELEDESRLESQRKAKKAKEAQKRKDKAAKKKEAQAEEKARREAEKAAEEAARLAEEARKAEEQRAKAEERRRKKEAQKKAEEEERKRKEAERLRKAHEREENERKVREAREREKKAREEARLKEKEAREQKEREAREKKEQQEREKREKEAKAKAEREAKETASNKKTKQEERAAQKAAAIAAAVPVPVPPITLPKRPAPHAIAAVPVPALPQQSAFVGSNSPQIPVATPAFAKAPTPMRVRQPSQQHEGPVGSSGGTSQAGSAPSQNPSPHPMTPVHSSPGPIGPPSKLAGIIGHGGQDQSSHSASPLASTRPLPHQPSPFMAPPAGMAFPPGIGHAPPGFGNPGNPGFPPMSGYRPAMIPMPPGFGGPGAGRGFPVHPPPGLHGPLDSPIPAMAHIISPIAPKESIPSHSRHGSGSFDPGTPSQAISRPAPIGRPGSVVHGQRHENSSPAARPPKPDVDTHLGSKALLDDVDDSLDLTSRPPRMGLSSSLPRMGAGFPAPFGMDPFPWGSSGVLHQVPVHPPLFPQYPPPGFGQPVNNTPWGPQPGPLVPGFGIPGVGVPDRAYTEPRSVQVRKMLRRACEELADNPNVEGGKTSPGDRFVPIMDILARVESAISGNAVTVQELLDLCETEGNEVNGGGSFDVRGDAPETTCIRFVSSSGRTNSQPLFRAVGAPGEIGSPIVGGAGGTSR
ncbi:salt tolerance down-regulator-domain-containing protein [Rhypophila decipiens]|uniref:Stress response protein NST1 n=1 Tax=Rhypophila decipiens TaxID=261697 RepID=A0AAN6Y4M8_9PEZI|nr:salt tolerance down-regulator-domain-containing protein [Rhypophila decipiens]